ncbi:MAG: DMT family transporter [Mesorhizobium sp.]
MSQAQRVRTTMTAGDWLLVLLLGALWGGSFFFARIAVGEIAPLTLVFLRVAIAAAALHLLLLLRGPSFRLALPRAGSAALLALFNNIIPFSLIFAGQTEIGAGLAAVLNATTPFWTALIAARATTDERLTLAKVAGILLGIAGTGVMIVPGLAAGLGGPVWAKLAIVGAALSYAAGAILARRFGGVPPTVTATAQLTVSTLVMAPVAFASGGAAGAIVASAGAWSAVLALALVSTAFAYIIYFRLVGTVGATNASLVTLVVPAFAVLLGAAFLAERLEPFELGGMLLIGIGLAVIDGRILSRFGTWGPGRKRLSEKRKAPRLPSENKS